MLMSDNENTKAGKEDRKFQKEEGRVPVLFKVIKEGFLDKVTSE